MVVRSSKISSYIFKSNGCELTAIVETKDQSIKNQPVLWLVHGSGGLSSSEDIWKQKAFEHGFTCVSIDSYTGRNIFKTHWDGNDTIKLSSIDRSEDIFRAREKFVSLKSSLFNWVDDSKNVLIGFSDGGTAVIHLLTRENTDWVTKPVYAFYPSFYKIDSKVFSISEKSVHIFVGEHDNWTPAAYSQDFCDKTNNEITIFKDTHHSFSKPGVAEWHQNSFNHKGERGVYCEYNEDATELAMDYIFNDYNNISSR
jgi:dienelactone hydrolase